MKLIAPHPEPKTTMVFFFGSIAHDSIDDVGSGADSFRSKTFSNRSFQCESSFRAREDAEKFCVLVEETRRGVAGVPMCASFIQKTTPRPNALSAVIFDARRKEGKKDMTAECRPFFLECLPRSCLRRQKNVDTRLYLWPFFSLFSPYFFPIFYLIQNLSTENAGKLKKERGWWT